MNTLRDYVADAERRGVAIGHFNISNLEAFHAVCVAARELNLPVIIGVSEGEREFVGVHEAAALVHMMREKYNQPVFLNADHTYSLKGVKEAIDAGFDAVIFDGVKLSLDENIATTKECVEYAKKNGRDILVEAEIGNIGQSSKILDEIPEGVATNKDFLTKPEEAKYFVEKTGVDLLAPAVGNMHGMLKGGKNPKIDIERIKQIRETCGVPLVLHGGSGTSDEDFQSAIKAGVSIIHINTEIRIAFKDSLKQSLKDNKKEIAPYKFMKPTEEAIKKVVLERLKLFNFID
jgi:fructose-bisphosphate aldolase class II